MSISQYRKYDRFVLGIDCIIFGFDGKQLKALFIKRAFEPEQGRWSLMGGFMSKDESTDAAAARILKTLTGLSSIYMEQLSCYGEVNRDPGGRVVSIAYFALINIQDYSEELLNLHNAKWYSLKRLPALIFDHKKMVLDALAQLRAKAYTQPLGFELLPKKFTLLQLQNLYEAIYNTTFDKRNFTKKILSLSVLKRLNEKNKETSKKGAYFYVFDKKKYQEFASGKFKFI